MTYRVNGNAVVKDIRHSEALADQPHDHFDRITELEREVVRLSVNQENLANTVKHLALSLDSMTHSLSAVAQGHKALAAQMTACRFNELTKSGSCKTTRTAHEHSALRRILGVEPDETD